MWALDQVKNFFTGDVNIDNPEVRQALKNAFPKLANEWVEFDDFPTLPAEYIQEKIVPAIMEMKQENLEEFKRATEKSSSSLNSLANDVEQTLRYRKKDGKALPWNQSVPDMLKTTAKSSFKTAQDFFSDIANLRTDAEKERSLMAEIVASANRSTIKFDQYVKRGDGKQYGDKANDLFEIDSLHRDIRRPAWDKTIRHDVENVPKMDFVDVVNDIVEMAKAPGATVLIDGKPETVGDGTRLAKLAYLASWMSALEDGCDTVLPNALAQGAANVVKTAANGALWAVGDFATSIYDEYPTTTILTGMIITGAIWKATKSVSGFVGESFKIVWKGAAFIPLINKIAPWFDKAGSFFSWLSTASSAWWTEWPETPRRFTAASPDELKDFKPGESNHQEYYKKTLEHIKWLSTAATPVNTNEVNKRTSQFMRLDEEYRRWKMSLSEYLKRTEDIITGKWRIVVVDHSWVIDKAATQKNVIQRVADRTPGVSQFTRNLPEGSATASVNAIQKAKSRIKGTSYESVDFAWQKIEFADTTAKSLFEGFRDKLERYTQMQEWDATNREIIAKEWLITKIQNTDIPATQRDITAKAWVIAWTPQTIPWAPMVIPWQPPIPTQIPNPLYATLSEDLRQLQQELRDLNNQVRTINREVATLRGKPHAYVPTGGTRLQFQNDIRALKLEISNPAVTWAGATGLVEKINHHAGSTVIPDTAFNPKDLKLDKVRLLEVVKVALKK